MAFLQRKIETMILAKSASIVVVLPAYNEEPSLDPLFLKMRESLSGSHYQIILVDDGSTDGTAGKASSQSKTMPVRLIQRAKNGGLGVALSDGLREAVSSFDESALVVTMDADNTFHPNLIASMVDRIQKGADVVIASRYIPGASIVGLSAGRRAFSRVLSFFLRFLFPSAHVRDFSSGYRCYRLSLIKKILETYDPPLRAKGFPVMMEILLKAVALGAKCDEVPVEIRYDLKGTKTKLKFFKACLEYAKIFWLSLWDINRRGADPAKDFVIVQNKNL